jgi:hypothetical protein
VRVGVHPTGSRPGSVVRLIGEPSNKGMKLTSVERIGRSQLIPSVRRTVGDAPEP